MLRGALCYRLAKMRMQAPNERESDSDSYSDWRDDAMRDMWQRFSDADVAGKDVLDFGCGEGPLALYLAHEKSPRSIVGIDIDQRAIARAEAALATQGESDAAPVNFILGDADRLPIDDASVDTVLAFDCMEHVMDPPAILREWRRVLRPHGKVLIEWFPFKGPWGAHMNSLVPIPWAPVVFGERAVFEAAARIYDDPDFVPRSWDRDAQGDKLPNKWAATKTFAQQRYLNQLDIRTFQAMVGDIGFRIVREDRFGFGHAGWKQRLGEALVGLPLLGEYLTSYILIELERLPDQ